MWSSDKPTEEGTYCIYWSELSPVSCMELVECGGTLRDENGRKLDDWWEDGIGVRRLGPFTADDVLRGMEFRWIDESRPDLDHAQFRQTQALQLKRSMEIAALKHPYVLQNIPWEVYAAALDEWAEPTEDIAP